MEIIMCISVNILVKNKSTQQEIMCNKNQSLLQALQEHELWSSAVCGGGICGKCGVRVIKGYLEPSQKDRKVFALDDIELGYRLACTAYPTENLSIMIENLEAEFQILSQYDVEEKEEVLPKTTCTCGIFIDIGSTTIAMQLIDLDNNIIKDTYTAINSQRIYGADVISRIKASNEGKRTLLQKMICENLKKGIDLLFEKNNMVAKRIAVSGNTVMIHLLMGYSLEGLSKYPFFPVTLEAIHTSYKELFSVDTYEIPIMILPGISAFVGGDILAGLLACGFSNNEKISVLLDLGTNGEMAVGNKDRILVTSTAAGPAFEGGNLTWGVGSVQGAISHVSIENGTPLITTIGDSKPVGICGTGVLETIAELLKEGILDETGLLQEEFFDNGYSLGKNSQGESIVLTQKDIREVQLAKAAVRAGLEVLIDCYPVMWSDIDTIYIAGGFGYTLDVKKAIQIGMLPKEFSGRIRTVGNSALKGTMLYLLNDEERSKSRHIINISNEINLSMEKEFQDYYMNCLDLIDISRNRA